MRRVLPCFFMVGVMGVMIGMVVSLVGNSTVLGVRARGVVAVPLLLPAVMLGQQV